MGEDEAFLPFPLPKGEIAPATAFRSTWLGSSILALRERGHFDRYLTLLPQELHDSILTSVAGQWIPIEVAIQHYLACERLGLSRGEAWAIGVSVTQHVHRTSLDLALRLARQAGATPWAIFGQLGRLWERIWQGGAVAVYRKGPKEAVVEVVKWRCAGIGYVQTTMPAVLLGMTEHFCKKAYVHTVPSMTSSDSIGVRAQWV